MSWNVRDRVKWLLSSRFRQNLTARRAREAEVRPLRMNIDARMFVREIYQQQLYENDELRLKPGPLPTPSADSSMRLCRMHPQKSTLKRGTRPMRGGGVGLRRG
jgi:hypothetical protein